MLNFRKKEFAPSSFCEWLEFGSEFKEEGKNDFGLPFHRQNQSINCPDESEQKNLLKITS